MAGKSILYSGLTDCELIIKLKNDDHSAYAEVFERYSNLIYAHASNKLRDRNEARDVVQEIFLKIWEKRQSIDQSVDIAKFLFVAARNSILNLIRHKNIVDTYGERFKKSNEDSGIYTDTLVREKEFSAMIEREIANLPPRMRQVFELRKRHYFTNKQVADQLGIAESTVEDQMKKAIRILRSKIGILGLILFYLNIK